MDNTAQKTNGSVQSPVAPVGSVNKEVGTIHVTPAPEAGPIIRDQEVAGAGIAEVEQSIRLEEEHERMGVRLSAESTPVRTEPTGVVQLPMTQQEIARADKRGAGGFDLTAFFSGINIIESAYGLARLLKKIQQRLVGQPT